MYGIRLAGAVVVVVIVVVVICAGKEGMVAQVRSGVDDDGWVARWRVNSCLVQGPAA